MSGGPGNWSTKKVQGRSADQHSFTYSVSGVGVESTGVDLDVCKICIDCSSKLKVGCPAPGIGVRRKFRNVLQTSIRPRTSVAVVALEGASVDPHLGAYRSNCSALLSWMSGPRNWSTKKVQERSADQHSFTYVCSGVALDSTGVDLHLGAALRINCSALLSWMSGPGNWSMKKVQKISWMDIENSRSCLYYWRQSWYHGSPALHQIRRNKLLRPSELDVPPRT
jgi:hypothetical protein